jgi:hypothetical protein
MQWLYRKQFQFLPYKVYLNENQMINFVYFNRNMWSLLLKGTKLIIPEDDGSNSI